MVIVRKLFHALLKFSAVTDTEAMGPGVRRDDEDAYAVFRYSITATASPCACLRSAALLDPIISASGIAHIVTIITSW